MLFANSMPVSRWEAILQHPHRPALWRPPQPLETLCGDVVKGRDSPVCPHWTDGRPLHMWYQKEKGKEKSI